MSSSTLEMSDSGATGVFAPHEVEVPGAGSDRLRRTRSLSERAGPSWGTSGPDELTPLIGTAKGASESDEAVIFSSSRHKSKGGRLASIFKHVKVGILFIIAFTFSVIYCSFPDSVFIWQPFSISSEISKDFMIANPNDYPVMKMYIKARLSFRRASSFTHNLNVKVTNPGTNNSQTIKAVFAKQNSDNPEIIQEFEVDFGNEPLKDAFLVQVSSNRQEATPVSLVMEPVASGRDKGVAAAAFILLAVYILIIFDLIHRSLAAMLGALVAIAVLASYNEKPAMEDVLSWLDYETLCLLFGMMVLVAILVDTGLFDWVALQAYKIAKGKTWPLITTLCIFSAVISAFLDNVTTILLLAPVTIRLCEVLDLDPKHVLIAEVLFSNIGGTSTAIGDPPNVIIVSSKDITESGIDFGTFTLHMSIGSVFCAIAAYALLRFIYRRKAMLHRGFPREVAEMKHELAVWNRAANQIVVTTREEFTVRALLMQKVETLDKQIELKIEKQGEPSYDFFKLQLDDMERRYKIRDGELLIKCLAVLFTVTIAFFLTSFIKSNYLNLGWIPVFGAVGLLILGDYSDLESILHRIEWATLLFFSGLYVMMQALTKLGLIDWIANQTILLVQGLDEGQRLPVAIIVIIWVSAICSSFVDNIPFTTAMLPVIVKLSGDETINMPLQPLVWSLAFGACLGGNGTLVGASANVVAAGIAETHGHKFSFWQFFKVGFPTMLVTTTLAMVYLLICHVAFTWH